MRACSRLATRGRGRVVRGRGRGGASGWLTSRSVVPASAVPEELIAQAQVVLQDKSRAAIVRELQRTVSFALLRLRYLTCSYVACMIFS